MPGRRRLRQGGGYGISLVPKTQIFSPAAGILIDLAKVNICVFAPGYFGLFVTNKCTNKPALCVLWFLNLKMHWSKEHNGR